MYESLMEAVVNDEKVAQALEAVKRNQGAPGTWRLHGSRPPYRYVPPQGLSSGRAFVCLDRFLDGATQGPTWLRQPDIAAMCLEALHYGDQVLNHYRLQAWVVMPNHVHLLISPLAELAKIMHSVKGFTARRANQTLGRVGLPFWEKHFLITGFGMNGNLNA